MARLTGSGDGGINLTDILDSLWFPGYIAEELDQLGTTFLLPFLNPRLLKDLRCAPDSVNDPSHFPTARTDRYLPQSPSFPRYGC